jgi:hypothetical protein
VAAVVVKSDAEEQRGLTRKRLMIVGKGSRGMNGCERRGSAICHNQTARRDGRAIRFQCLLDGLGWAGGDGARGEEGETGVAGTWAGEWASGWALG